MRAVSRFLTLLAVMAAALMALTATTASAAVADGTAPAGACAEATEVIVFELDLGDRAEAAIREGGRTVGAGQVTEILARLSGRSGDGECMWDTARRTRQSLASPELQDVCAPCTVARLTKTQLETLRKLASPDGVGAGWLTLEPTDPALAKTVANATGDVCDPCMNTRLSVPKLVETLLKNPRLLRAQLPGGGSVLTLLALAGGRHDTAKNSIGNVR